MINEFVVIGDVHGMAAELRDVCGAHPYAKRIYLGDLVDRGTNSGEVINFIDYEADVGRVEAIVIGNHDHKLYRYFRGRKVVLSEEAQRSVSSIEEEHAVDAFVRLMDKAYLMYRRGNRIFVHAAAHRAFYAEGAQSLPYADFFTRQAEIGALAHKCLFGYTTGNYVDGYPERLMDWVQDIPNGVTVYKGHDFMYPEVHTETNAQGGQLVWVDTGAGSRSGTPGKLSGITFKE